MCYTLSPIRTLTLHMITDHALFRCVSYRLTLVLSDAHRVMSMLEIVESLSSPPHHSRRRHAQPPPDLLNRSLSPDSTLSSRSASPTSSTGGRSTTDDMVRSVDGDGHSDDDMNGLSRGGRRTEDEVTEENKMLNDVFFSPCC